VVEISHPNPSFKAFKEILQPCGARIFGVLASGADHRPLAMEQVCKTLLMPIIGLSRNEAKTQKDRSPTLPNRIATEFL
jgi:hypothetical protein